MERKAAARLLATLLGSVALACTGTTTDAGFPAVTDGAAGADGALRGEIARLIADRDDGTSEILYFLRLADGSERRLTFARDPGLPPYTPVAIWGSPAGTDAEPDAAVVVSSFRVEETASASPSASPPDRVALVAAARAEPRRFAFVLIDTGGGVNLSRETARQRMFDADFFTPNLGSIRRYYQEASYGIQDITGDVFGPIAYTPVVPCDTRGVTTLRDEIDAMAGGPSDHYLWYFGSRQTGCNFSGLASQGSPDRPARDTWYNASSGCVVLVQEPGHNFGMQHSSSMACPGASFIDEPEGVCVHSEYGDAFDPMGSGCRHMNAWQKTYEGWLAGCNGVRVTSSGTFTLFPIETACNGVQLLQVPMPRTRPFTHAGGGSPSSTDLLTNYYIELRAPVGFDDGLSPAVLVHVASDLRGSSRNGLHTWLLDMTPETESVRDAGLPVGRTFTDPAGGLGITVLAVGATRASIQIDIDGGRGGAPACLDGATLAAPGPQSCDEAPAGTGGGAGGTGGAGVVGRDGPGLAASSGGCGCGLGTPPAAPPVSLPTLVALAALLARGRAVTSRRRSGSARAGGA